MKVKRQSLALLVAASATMSFAGLAYAQTSARIIRIKPAGLPSVLATPTDFCTLKAEDVNILAFPSRLFNEPPVLHGDMVATVYLSGSEAYAEVHLPSDARDTRAAVLALTMFISQPLSACTEAENAVPVSFGAKELSIVTENGVAVDFRYDGPKE